MKAVTIESVKAQDRRFPLDAGAGSDAVHTSGEYAFPVTYLRGSSGLEAFGIVLTLGDGNKLVCDAIEQFAARLVGREIEELMAAFGAFSRGLADDPALRWLGPHKGVVHLALASITNACFDLWAKARGVPLWRLLLDLTPEQVVALLDLSYLEDALTADEALDLLRGEAGGRQAREGVIADGYPGYDTSVGWFQYDDEQVRENVRRALGRGFQAFKLKVGSRDGERDLRRASMLREVAGSECRLMFDVNQQWTYAEAERMCLALRAVDPFWVEEPTHPDDVAAHARLVRAVAPVKIALGEHVPNRVIFKNYMQAGALYFVQPDCTRLAGVAEFLTVSLLARKFGLPVVPHVGDMGQIHQHLVLFNRVALGHELIFLEHIPHLRKYFVHPAAVEGGVYRTPQEPGLSCDLK